jgi:HEAT repeat protein
VTELRHPLLEGLQSSDPSVYGPTVNELKSLSDERLLPLLEAGLADSNVAVRTGCMVLLTNRPSTVAVPWLTRALVEDPDVNVRRLGAMALGNIGGQQAVEGLVRALDDPSDDVCAAAAVSLAVIDNARVGGEFFDRLPMMDWFLRYLTSAGLFDAGLPG